jgi:predicted nucleic acid-binding protein
LTNSLHQRRRFWADAYLAALALSADLALSTFDDGFKHFAGLTLELVDLHQ